MQKFIPYSLNVGGRLVEISRPWVMGVVNVTPDSFFPDSRVNDLEQLERRVRQMLDDGADVIDVGACSTRPGAVTVAEDEELRRLQWALPVVRRMLPERVLLSVDTFRAGVAATAVEQWGAQIVNDISGATLDPDMECTLARLQVPIVAMHMRGTPATMQQLTDYDNVTAQVLEWLARRVDHLHQLGVVDVIADPGFGFAKTVEQNYELLAHLDVFHALQVPLLVGVSRKSMVMRPLGCDPAHALGGTTVLHTAALLAGAHMLRVHDVRAAVEARTLCMMIMENG